MYLTKLLRLVLIFTLLLYLCFCFFFFFSRINFSNCLSAKTINCSWYIKRLSRQKLCIAVTLILSSTKLIAKTSTQGRHHSQERRDSEGFPVSIGVCAVFLGRRDSRNYCISLEAMLLDGVANKLAVVDFLFFFPCVTV